ncbi:type 1 periplasmic binding fold superfamily protein [Robiginitalea sp. SC105]|uniref:type 1 periplasmic binding fold superfamily protein n=1 Tax=Robiginitalea sp. SC105 TaxID=2762332 RepID=UPI00163AA27D|nr:type 1 periplasmic binding fold superfamily protein [Robiginitalea sp. SC105]MBC2840646.1 type 1 periplasmic binding fold superfamily protein [Robiginitalea sp. SC105]
MKKIQSIVLLLAISLFLSSCSNDDGAPEPVNEEEIITTVTVTLVPQGGGSTIVLESRDLDGDGPNAPEVTASGNLAANAVYDGSIVLLNETETPAENITTEVAAEAAEHQFIFGTSGSIASVSYADQDENGNPVGILFELATGVAGNGTLSVTLRHEPLKPNDGTLAGAGGETDVAQTFAVTVE